MSNPLENAPMLFGAYVESATANMGYGADSSTCQLSLVFEGDGPLRASDLESNFPELGTAVAFVLGEFKFGGILQRYTHKRSLSGYRYDFIIESPSKWLDGIQIILERFQGTTFPSVTHTHPQDNINLINSKFNTQNNYVFTDQINNIWNPFAILENYQYGGTFGDSDTNSAGFPAKKALELIEEISRGEHPFGGKAVFGESEYEVDLSELIPIVPEFFRIKGPSQSLNAILQECCEIALHDYVVFVEPKNGKMTNGIIKNPVIKIKVIDKKDPPTPNTIKTIINQYEQEQKLISADFGKEFSDTVTQKLVIGGPASRHCISSPYNFYPIWGKTNGVRPRYIVGSQTVAYGGMDMNAPVPVVLNSGAIYNANVLEIRCAISSFDTWILYKVLSGDQSLSKFCKVRIDNFTIQGLINGSLTIQQLFNTKQEVNQANNPLYSGKNPLDELQKVHSAIKSVGENFYGKKFLVPLPFEPGGIDNNIKFVSEDQQYITSWELVDSAWVDNKPFSDVAFYDGDGKLKAVGSWVITGQFDYSGLGNNYAFGLGGLGSVVTVEKDIFWLILGEDLALPYCVVEVPEVLNFDQYTTEKLGLVHLLKLIRNITINPSTILRSGGESGPSSYGIAPAKASPVYISVPQESNRYCWGPWWKYSSKKGKAEVLFEDSLTPETFGSSTILNNIGYDYAFVSNANVSGNESGYVEVAEIPNYNLAQRFAVSGPYVTNIDIVVGLDGVKTTYKFNTWTPQFGRLAKYNADRISRINKASVAFLQRQREKFLKPPFPQKTAIDMINRSSFFGMITPAMNMIMGQTLGLGNNKKGVNVQNQAVQGAMTAKAGDNAQSQSFGCTPEQIWSPVVLQKPDQKDPKTLNPYFSFNETDFGMAVIEGNDVSSMDLKENKDKITTVRTMGLRGPILMSGWGYDISGNPVPAKNGSPTEFHENAATDRSLWKSGPIDLKWDESKKMWVAGQPEIIEGILISDIAAPQTPFDSTFGFTIRVKRYNGNDFVDGPQETIINRDPFLSLTLDSASNGKILVVAMKVNQEWRPIWVSCPPPP